MRSLQINAEPGWNSGNARYLAVMSSLAYDQTTVSCAATDTQALIWRTPLSIAIAFRGTSSLRDFLIDADCLRADLPYTGRKTIRVHSGFLEAYESIIPAVVKYLGTTDLPLFITGHSLGGALALLCGLDLMRNGRYNVHSVYTFGQPRVGNAAFAGLVDNRLGDRYQRVVFENDLVARVPRIPSVFDPYCHAGQEILLEEWRYGAVHNPSFTRRMGLELSAAWRALFLKRETILMDALDDHHLDNYIRRLK